MVFGQLLLYHGVFRLSNVLPNPVELRMKWKILLTFYWALTDAL